METKVSSDKKEVIISIDRPTVIIGERINPTGRKKLTEALKTGDLNMIRNEAITQVKAGADIIALQEVGSSQAAALETSLLDDYPHRALHPDGLAGIGLLSRYPIATRLSLTGPMVVARDIAHARLKEGIDAGKGLPQYLKDHPVYYAGPAKKPEGLASGSFGPTTAGRMDPYVPIFQAQGGSMIMLAKGNRSRAVTESCKKFGGFYLGSIGGPAARLGKECITSVETVEYEELGMEAIFMIAVKDFPAFIIVDDKGNDFFEKLLN